jgi:hypothetical protein
MEQTHTIRKHQKVNETCSCHFYLHISISFFPFLSYFSQWKTQGLHLMHRDTKHSRIFPYVKNNLAMLLPRQSDGVWDCFSCTQKHQIKKFIFNGHKAAQLFHVGRCRIECRFSAVSLTSRQQYREESILWKHQVSASQITSTSSLCPFSIFIQRDAYASLHNWNVLQHNLEAMSQHLTMEKRTTDTHFDEEWDKNFWDRILMMSMAGGSNSIFSCRRWYFLKKFSICRW